MQFFLMIFYKAEFDSRISQFFSDYLINRHTQYVWNSFISPFLRTDVGVGQVFTLLPILLAFYIALIFHILEKRTKNLSSPILISFLSFFDDSLLISQEKSFEKSNANLFYSYSIISSIFKQFGLVIEYDKSEIFHFSRASKKFNSSSLDLRFLGNIILKQKKKDT